MCEAPSSGIWVATTTEQYKTESQANKAADQLRLSINNATPAARVPTVGLVAQHFKNVELTESNTRRAWSTKENYKEMLNLFILPRWKTTRMVDVKSVGVEGWLASLLSTKTGKPLENGTKQRIRNIFSVLFTHAQRFEFVPQGHNPISFVRQTGEGSRIPDILEPWEINAIWLNSLLRERAAMSILRRHVQRTPKNLGIAKKIGWHTFRRTYASLLKANGEDVKVVQELCRHANPSTTLTLYAQAFTKDARRAQGKVVEMVRKASKPEELTMSGHIESLHVLLCNENGRRFHVTY